MVDIKLPSRYEDLDTAYRGRLIPDKSLLALVNKAKKSMDIVGGIRFLPIYGQSGAGKSCAAREISTHMPSVYTFVLTRDEVESKEALLERIHKENKKGKGKLLVAIIDQFEENVSGKERIPTQFVEHISLLDRDQLRKIPILFIWLTTSKSFQLQLAEATSRNKRILVQKDFEIVGPDRDNWAKIIEETFAFHNAEKSLADYQILNSDIGNIADETSSIGTAIQEVGDLLANSQENMQDLSEYEVVIMWPVADSTRNQRVLQFSNPREGYKLTWEAFYNQLNDDDKRQLPLKELNRSRLYFDVRIIPIRAADLHKLCLHLESDNFELATTHISRFKQTHFYHVVSNSWETYNYNPVRERESKRADEAKEWYSTITNDPVIMGKRIAYILRKCGLNAEYEKNISTEYGSVRADIYVDRPNTTKSKVIIELKLYSSENTMPSSIKDAIKVTLRRHAQLAGFLPRQ